MEWARLLAYITGTVDHELNLAEGSADPQGLLSQTHASHETLKLRVENNAIKVRIHFYPN
jgi:hypothetical protein